MMPLVIAPEGQEFLIKKVSGDGKIKKHLESLGIVEDQKIRVLNHGTSGTIVLVNSTRLALDCDIASKIIVM